MDSLGRCGGREMYIYHVCVTHDLYMHAVYLGETWAGVTVVYVKCTYMRDLYDMHAVYVLGTPAGMVYVKYKYMRLCLIMINVCMQFVQGRRNLPVSWQPWKDWTGML